MKLLSFVLATLALSSSAFAEVRGTCRLVNAAGVAQMDIAGQRGTITGLTGASPIRSVRSESQGFAQLITIEYVSKLAEMQGGHDSVEVTLAVVPSPATALMGVNYQGVLLFPTAVPALAFPGPFGGMPSGWLNPFGPFIPTAIPTGYVPIAAAYCSL